MQKFDLKKLFKDKNYGWNEGFKFEIIFSNSGVARIYINDRKTKYNADGYGYDKTSSVIASMVNDLIGEQPYNFEIYGNSGNYKKENEERLKQIEQDKKEAEEKAKKDQSYRNSPNYFNTLDV